MKDPIKEALRFYTKVTQLKYMIRSGWNTTHWNINNERLESIGEHVFGTCVLALAIESEFRNDFKIDMEIVLKMLVLHEIGETIIGDITQFDGVSPEEKLEKEHRAMREVLADLERTDEFYSLLLDFDSQRTKEAHFARLCDKLECDLQSKVYQEMGCHHLLSEQQGNKVFNNPKVQQMMNDDIKTPFDIWYEFDKTIYENDPIFADILLFIKNNSIYI